MPNTNDNNAANIKTTNPIKNLSAHFTFSIINAISVHAINNIANTSEVTNTIIPYYIKLIKYPIT